MQAAEKVASLLPRTKQLLFSPQVPGRWPNRGCPPPPRNVPFANCLFPHTGPSAPSSPLWVGNEVFPPPSEEKLLSPSPAGLVASFPLQKKYRYPPPLPAMTIPPLTETHFFCGGGTFFLRRYFVQRPSPFMRDSSSAPNFLVCPSL